ncbi:MAG TPA: hypothetical protein VLA98_12555, partial [Solirubrobacteraceae bacterium]|nr:hypothetical protein [Solirubrobacteraceae bacterium]
MSTIPHSHNRPLRARERGLTGAGRRHLYDLALVLGVLAIVSGFIAGAVFIAGGGLKNEASASSATGGGNGASQLAAAPSAEQTGDVRYEPFQAVDPTLPAVPEGAVKRFDVDVYEHVTKVSDALAPLTVWSYAVNGVEHRGTGNSQPIVVEEGDEVAIELHNGS